MSSFSISFTFSLHSAYNSWRGMFRSWRQSERDRWRQSERDRGRGTKCTFDSRDSCRKDRKKLQKNFNLEQNLLRIEFGIDSHRAVHSSWLRARSHRKDNRDVWFYVRWKLLSYLILSSASGRMEGSFHRFHVDSEDLTDFMSRVNTGRFSQR